MATWMDEWQPIETIIRDGMKCIVGGWIKPDGWITAAVFPMVGGGFLTESGIELNWAPAVWTSIPDAP